MNRRAFPLLAALALASVAGCAPDRMMLEVQGICIPPESCVFSSSCDTQLMGTPAVLGGYDLSLPLQVANQLPNNENVGVGRLNTNDAHVTGAVVEMSGAVGGSFTESVGNVTVFAGGTRIVGVVLPTSLATVEGFVSAKVRLTGYYDSGREFETGDFEVGAFIVGDLGTCTGGAISTCPGDGTSTILQVPSVCVTP